MTTDVSNKTRLAGSGWMSGSRWGRRIGGICALAIVALLVAASCAGGDHSEATYSMDSAAASESYDMSDDAMHESEEMMTEESDASGLPMPTTTILSSVEMGDADYDEAGEDMAMAEEAAAETVAMATDEVELESQTGEVTPTNLSSPLLASRDIIYRANIAIEAHDVAAAASEASQAIAAIGGVVFGQNSTTSPIPRTVLIFKVAPADFAAALQALSDIGELKSQSLSADDVTERVVDLESRISTAAVSVDRLRELLSNATDIRNVATLESELMAREATLERLRGQLRTLRDQVALATITLEITEVQPEIPDAAMAAVVGIGLDRDEACGFGFSELQVETTSPVVLCVEIENVGDDVLGDVEITSPTLRLRTTDFDMVDVVEGTADDGVSVEPGSTVTAVAELEVVDGMLRRQSVSDGISARVNVTATPVSSPQLPLSFRENMAIIPVPIVVPDALMAVSTWLGEDPEDACPGVENLAMDSNGQVVLCVEIDNVGDDTLGEFDIRSNNLRLRVDDFELVTAGNSDASNPIGGLEPRQTLTAIATLDVSDSYVQRQNFRYGSHIDVEVRAKALSDPNNRFLTHHATLWLHAEPSDALPGLADSLSSALGTIANIGSIVLVVVGWLLPFAVLIAIVLVPVSYWYRRRRVPTPAEQTSSGVEAAEVRGSVVSGSHASDSDTSPSETSESTN